MNASLIKKIFFIICIAVCLTGYISSPVALLLGFIYTLFLGKQFDDYVHSSIQYLLKISVVGLGFGMFIGETLETGKEGLGLTVFTIITTIALGWILTKLFKLDQTLGHLISSGTAICGGSAIAAVAPVIKAKPKTISIALGVVFLLNSIALFIFPAIGHFLNMSQQQFGLWAAVAIHDTSSVVGAALVYGDEALRVATTVKLSRTLWIIPLSVVSMFMFKSTNDKVKIPWFILFFIIAILLNSYLPIPESITTGITSVAKRLLILTLFLVGSTLSIKELKSTGAKPFVLATILWIVISLSSLLLIMQQVKYLS